MEKSSISNDINKTHKSASSIQEVEKTSGGSSAWQSFRVSATVWNG